MSETDLGAIQAIALQFAQAIAQRDYVTAHMLTSPSYQQRISVGEIEAICERILPTDWGTISVVALDDVLEEWPDKRWNDIGWIYVSLEGVVYPYSEGLYICVSRENGHLIVSDVTYGRP